jgi:hypothetical protein
VSNKAHEFVQFFTDHPEFFKEDEVVQFFAEHPEFFDAMKSTHFKVLESRRLAASKHHGDLIRHYTRIIKVIAETEIKFTEGILPDLAKDRFTLINRLLGRFAAEPLPLLWPAKQGSASPSSGTDNDMDANVTADEENPEDWSSDDEFGDTEIFSRLAVCSHPYFTYQPDLFSGPSVTPWCYGTLYAIKYPDDNLSSSTNASATGPERLDELHVTLPRKVLDLGRLVVTSDMERSTSVTWTPSDFTVMVDMQSETKAVWLVCDSNVVDKLRFLNMEDGLADDFNDVHHYFDSSKMDLALLFPSINDWSSCDAWSVIESRIRQSAMKLGLSLHHT